MYRLKTGDWYLERAIYLLAGIMVLASLALSVFVSRYWLILTGLVGVNLIVFAATGFCLMAQIIAKAAKLKTGLNTGSCK